MAGTVLVNYWYAHPVGHAIEALRYCLGYKSADPELSVNLLLNEAMPLELVGCCPFVDELYGVPYRIFDEPDGDPQAALAGVPRDWDWVVDNHREREATHDAFRGFRAFFDASHEHFRPRLAHTWTGGEPPAYLRNQQLRLELPAASRARAREVLQGRQAIAVVLAGHSGLRFEYPSVASWRLILGTLAERFPETVFCLIGKHEKGHALSVSRIGASEVERVGEGLPVLDCFDLPLLDQLALVEASALFLSPHTGFGFAAVAVGTPWLELAGGQWHQSFFNGVPFYSVLPDTDRYPSFGWGAPLPTVDDSDGEGPRTVSMSAARIREDLPELVDGAGLLVERRLAYEDALRDYFPRLLVAYHGDRSRVFAFDGLDWGYV